MLDFVSIMCVFWRQRLEIVKYDMGRFVYYIYKSDLCSSEKL